MKVSKLIEILEECDPDQTVVLWNKVAIPYTVKSISTKPLYDGIVDINIEPIEE